METFLSLIQLLQETQSFENEKRKYAEQTLIQFESDPLFFVELMELIGNKSLDESIKFIAVIYLKNSIKREWKNKEFLVSQRDPFRRKLIVLITSEPTYKILLQLILTLSNIAQLDFPFHWPNLFHILLQICEERCSIPICGLLAIHYCLKECIAYEEKNPPFRSAFQQIAPQIFLLTEKTWREATIFLSNHTAVSNQLSELLSAAEFCKWSQKIVFSLITHKFVSFQENEVINTMKRITSQLEMWVSLKKSLPFDHPLVTYFEKFLVDTSKFICRTQELYPMDFVPFLSSFCTAYFTLFKISLPENFAIYGLLFFHNVLTCAKYRGEPNQNNGVQQIQAFFSNSVIIELAHILLNKYLILSEEALRQWEENPEGFANEELRGNITKQSGSVAEVLFSTILRKYSEILVPEILSISKSIFGSQDTTFQSLLFKDSCYHICNNFFFFASNPISYNQVSIAYYELRNKILFSQFFNLVILKDFQNVDPNYKIIKRRILQVIEGWAPGLDANFLNTIYPILIDTINTGDYVLRLWSLIALRSILKPSINVIVKLVEESTEAQTCKVILDVIVDICHQCGSHIVQFGSDILNSLLELWKRLDGDSQRGNLLKEPILITIKSLIPSMGELEATQFQHNLIPIIVYCTNINNADSLFILEPGLQLWLEVVRYSTELTQPLLELFPHLSELISQSNLEYIRPIMDIFKIYIIRGSTQSNFLPLMGSVISILHVLLIDSISNLKIRDVVSILSVIDVLLFFFPNEIPTHIGRILQNFMQFILSNSPAYELLNRYFFSTITVLLFTNKEIFLSLIRLNGEFTTFLELFSSKLNISDPDLLQRYVKAFCALLTFNEIPSVILKYISQIINVTVKIVENSNFKKPVSFINPPPEQKWIEAKDPFLNFTLPSFTLDCLQQCALIHKELFQQVIQTVDPSLIQKLHSNKK